MAAIVDRVLTLAPHLGGSPNNSPSMGHGPMSSASSTASSSSSSSGNDMVRCKRKINFQQQLAYGNLPGQPVSVARRNARERNRVKQVNNGFSTLRQHIPFTARNKKMSKVETLRCAVEYIRSLKMMLDEKKEDLVGVAASPVPSEVEAAAAPAPQHYQQAFSPTASDRSSVSSFQPQQHFQQPLVHHLMQPASLSPPCSAASEPASSPTPSFESETSSYHPMYPEPTSTVVAVQAYDNYQPMSPEDEDLLDAISWWQQSQ